MDAQLLEVNQLTAKSDDWFEENPAPLVAEYSDDHPTGSVARPVIQNIVSTVNLNCKLNLPTIAAKALNAEYNPKRFSAVIMRIKKPKTSALLFASGKIVCTGAKTEEASKIAARKFARIIQKLGFPVKFNGFRIQNIVGSCDVGFPVRLETMMCGHGSCSVYEPEIFPGLIYRMMNPRVKILVFASGKIVIAGAKVKDEMFRAFENIYPVLEQYKRVQG